MKCFISFSNRKSDFRLGCHFIISSQLFPRSQFQRWLNVTFYIIVSIFHMQDTDGCSLETLGRNATDSVMGCKVEQVQSCPGSCLGGDGGSATGSSIFSWKAGPVFRHTVSPESFLNNRPSDAGQILCKPIPTFSTHTAFRVIFFFP